MNVTEFGYERMVRAPSPNAVRWWAILIDGDFRFARGGLIRTCREARREIRNARERASRERAGRIDALRQLNAKVMQADGSLTDPVPL